MGMLLVIRDREKRFLGNMCPSVVIVGRSVVMLVTCRLVRCHFKWAFRNTRQSRLQPGSYNDLVGSSEKTADMFFGSLGSFRATLLFLSTEDGSSVRNKLLVRRNRLL